MDESAAEPAQPQTPLQNWKLTLAYDGTGFRGWQVQPGQPTIQGELQAALGRVTGEQPLPQGSGRTDAGVHALGQVASFALRAPIPAQNLKRALNRTLPDSIRVLESAIAPDGFHARHSAIAKTYEYRIFEEKPRATGESVNGEQAEGGTDAICPPVLARYVWICPWALDLGRLTRAACHFMGEHDFASFAAVDPDLAARTGYWVGDSDEEDEPRTAVRTIYESDWRCETKDGVGLLVYRVRGSGFLHHMVRNVVGTMVDAGRGFLPPDAIPAILAAQSRGAAGPTAPASGLFLHSVEYGEDGRRNLQSLLLRRLIGG